MLFSGDYIDREGNRRREVLSANDKQTALGELHRRADVVLSLRQMNLVDRFRQSLASRFGKARLSPGDLQSLAHILASYLKAGIAIQEALRLTAASNPRIGEVALSIRARLAAGLSLDQALPASGFAFPASFVALIKAGAESGTVHDVLASEAKRIRAIQEIRRDLATSLVYPAALIVMCVLVVGFMLAYIVPQIRSSVTEEALKNAPAFSIAIFTASDWLNAMTPQTLVLGLAFLTIGSGVSLRLSASWRNRMIVRAPIIGRIIVSLSASSFCHALGTMLAASVRTELAWTLATASVSQPHIRQALQRAGNRIVQGVPMSVAIVEAGVLPEDVTSVFSLGERTGTLPKLLMEVAEHHAGDALARLRKLASIAAPAVILISGLLVGAFAVAMMSTLLSVNQVYAG
ncbi:MAG: type II secretion system F family protein [Beijerinckiaceae bacterium]|nr:type II secretion system F family protein [Beijerinckiaceae bacterium]MCZ8298994.1 type II secretion system F family protein [Beijerinckiaceae bacterium]